MNKLFFTRRLKISSRKAKWGIVEIEREGKFYYNPCIFEEEGICYDIAMKEFLSFEEMIEIQRIYRD